jgi:hypothetical protein
MLLGVTGVGREYQLRRFAGAHPERLIPRGVSIGGDEDQCAVAEDVVVAIDELVVQGVIEVPRLIRVLRATRPRHLPCLDEEHRLWEKLIAAVVVKVKV